MGDAPLEKFAEERGPPVAHVSRETKINALKREIAYREKAYPKRVAAAQMSQEEADAQLSYVRAILEDYEVRAWPQLGRFVTEWLPAGLRIQFLGVPMRKATRDELVAVVAYTYAALRELSGVPGK